MSEDPTARPPGAGEGAGAPPTEEELRAAYEAELSRITVTDMVAQSAVSLLNMAARRLGPEPSGVQGGGEGAATGAAAPGGRDLEQVRDAIDAVRALLEILERRMPGEVGTLRDALSRLQMAYAAEVAASGGPEGPAGGSGEGPPGGGRSGGGQSGGAGGGGQPPGGGTEPGGAGGERRPAGEPAAGDRPRPGPAESSGRLWVPGR
jgi:hypothetical protein